jgi:hypothetical protein
LGTVLQEGDLLEILENYNSSTSEEHTHWIRVRAGITTRTYQFPAEGNAIWVTFPITLSNTVTMRTGSATNNYLLRVRVWRDAAYGYSVPTATEVRTACTVTCNGGAVNVNGAANAVAYAGTSMRVTVAMPGGQRIGTATANNGATAAVADARTGTIELAVPQGTTGAIDLTVTFVAASASAARLTTASRGAFATFGSIQVAVTASGNSHMMVRSSSSTGISLFISAHISWNETAQLNTSVNGNAGAGTAIGTAWNLGGAGNQQITMIHDTTNNRFYRVQMIIGASFVNNQFWCEELAQ